jgi:hypothetical protein
VTGLLATIGRPTALTLCGRYPKPVTIVTSVFNPRSNDVTDVTSAEFNNSAPARARRAAPDGLPVARSPEALTRLRIRWLHTRGHGRCSRLVSLIQVAWIYKSTTRHKVAQQVCGRSRGPIYISRKPQ